MHKKITLFLLIIFFYNCSSRSNSAMEVISFNEKDVNNVEQIKSSEILNVLDSVVNTNCILNVGDKLIINELGTKGLFHGIDLNNEKYIGLFGDKGRGAGEIGMPLAFIKDENSNLQIFDPQQKKIVQFNINALPETKVFQKEFILKKLVGSTTGLVLGDTVYSLNHIRPNHRVHLSDLDGNIAGGFGSMPENDKKLPDNVFAEGHAANIQFRNDIFAIGYKTTPIIQIFNRENKKEILIKGPEDFPSMIEENSNDFIALAYTKETRIGYVDIKISEKYIYALYSGKKLFDPTHSKCNIVYVFDLNGNPIKKLMLDQNIDCFDVYNDNYIYGINIGLKNKLFKFKI